MIYPIGADVRIANDSYDNRWEHAVRGKVVGHVVSGDQLLHVVGLNQGIYDASEEFYMSYMVAHADSMTIGAS